MLVVMMYKQQASAGEKPTKLCDIPMQIIVKHGQKRKTTCSIAKAKTEKKYEQVTILKANNN
eukprot:12721840-Ditylum_brightwellii.AAC.1